MVYLFSNRSYGAPFLEAAARFARVTNTPISIVFSGHRQRDREGGPVAMLRSLAAKWRSSREPAAGLPLLIVDDVNAPAFVKVIRPGDVGIIAGFDQIFRQDAISRFKSIVNVHPSLLPYYRGPEPAYWCIEYGETTTGFTIHSVTTKIDAGEILHQEALAIDPGDDAASLTRRIAALAVPAFEHWLNHVAAGAPWTPTIIDAQRVYRRRVDYRSFQDADASRR